MLYRVLNVLLKGYWMGDCVEEKKLREQQMFTCTNKKFIHTVHTALYLWTCWSLGSKLSYEGRFYISTEWSVFSRDNHRKCKAPEPGIFGISHKRRRLDTPKQKTAIRGRSPIVSYVNQTLTTLDPLQRWRWKTVVDGFYENRFNIWSVIDSLFILTLLLDAAQGIY